MKFGEDYTILKELSFIHYSILMCLFNSLNNLISRLKMLLRRKISYKISYSIWCAKIIVVVIFVNKQDTYMKIYDYKWESNARYELYCVMLLFLCTLCGQFPWFFFDFVLPLRYSLTFIYCYRRLRSRVSV